MFPRLIACMAVAPVSPYDAWAVGSKFSAAILPQPDRTLCQHMRTYIYAERYGH